tara:strand:- start:219 stop:524 length:306 start_codon:yes stop_codon:yes gene_type:complete
MSVFLIEKHKQEIWEWKQKESQWVRDKNQLEGNKTIINELSTKLIEMGKLNLSLQGTLGSAQDINTEHQKYNSKLQLRLTEVEDDNKKLAKQIEHLTNRKT